MLRFLMPCVSFVRARFVFVAGEEELQDRHECQRYVILLRAAAAFEFAEGMVRTFQIAFAEARHDDDIVDVRCNWLMKMNPYWLVRLNDLLAWLNPALGLVAALLALLTIAAAAERFPRNAASPAVQGARSVQVVASAECARPALPPELRDMRLYD
ncbi:MAG: hypothetical protein ACREEK_25235 [Bradyrhizobium sp.]